MCLPAKFPAVPLRQRRFQLQVVNPPANPLLVSLPPKFQAQLPSPRKCRPQLVHPHRKLQPQVLNRPPSLQVRQLPRLQAQADRQAQRSQARLVQPQPKVQPQAVNSRRKLPLLVFLRPPRCLLQLVHLLRKFRRPPPRFRRQLGKLLARLQLDRPPLRSQPQEVNLLASPLPQVVSHQARLLPQLDKRQVRLQLAKPQANHPPPVVNRRANYPLPLAKLRVRPPLQLVHLLARLRQVDRLLRLQPQVARLLVRPLPPVKQPARVQPQEHHRVRVLLQQFSLRARRLHLRHLQPRLPQVVKPQVRALALLVNRPRLQPQAASLQLRLPLLLVNQLPRYQRQLDRQLASLQLLLGF